MERHKLPESVSKKLVELHQAAMQAQVMAQQVVGTYQQAVAVAAGMLDLDPAKAQFDLQAGELVEE